MSLFANIMDNQQNVNSFSEKTMLTLTFSSTCFVAPGRR